MVVGSGRSVALTAGGVSSPAVALAQFLELVEERGLAVPGEALREFIEAGEKMISEQFDNEGRIDPAASLRNSSVTYSGFVSSAAASSGYARSLSRSAAAAIPGSASSTAAISGSSLRSASTSALSTGF
jgi:hypothetical protein